MEGWRGGSLAKNQKRKGSRSRKRKGSRIQGVKGSSGKGRRLEGWRVRGLEGLLKTGKAKEKAFYLAEDAEDAEL